MSQINYNGTIQDISMEQYIEETETFRKKQCLGFTNDLTRQFPIQKDKRSDKVILPVNKAKSKLEMAFIGGEIKALETVLNVVLFHMTQNETLDVVLGDIELALTKKLEINNRKFAQESYSADSNEILNRLIEVCEQAKIAYREKICEQ